MQHLGQGILRLYPFAFLMVGLAVLFLRLEDPNAWLVALMFGGFIAIPGFANSFLGVPASLRPLAIAYRAIFDNMVPALFYFFFAVFPTQSPLDRRVPWLKWLALVLGLALALPLGVALVLPASGGTEPTRVAGFGWLASKYAHLLILLFNYGLIALGFVSLTWSALTVGSSEARRKIRVILAGTLVGVVPATLAIGSQRFFRISHRSLAGRNLDRLAVAFPPILRLCRGQASGARDPGPAPTECALSAGATRLFNFACHAEHWYDMGVCTGLCPLSPTAHGGGRARRHRFGHSLWDRFAVDWNAGPQKRGGADRPSFLPQRL